MLACVVVHTFCNWMGFPRFWGRLTRSESIVLDSGEGKRDEDRVGERSITISGHGELGIMWTIAYYVLLVTGAVGFHRLLWTLTESQSALTTFT
jgi:prenyl protein peptidase